jgi:DNA uptake protein ComE-like DNA-binding protein
MLRHFFHLTRIYFELDHRQAKSYQWLLLFTILVVCSPLITYHLYPSPYGPEDVQVFLEQSVKSNSSNSSVDQTIVSRKRIDLMEEEDWIKIGLPIHLVKRITNYQKKVKPLKMVSDLYRIYGLDSSEVSRLRHYLEDATIKHSVKSGFKIKPKYSVININQADSLTLQALPSIGPVFTKRILKYRSLLSGYVSKNQYQEIYGITAEALSSLQTWTEIGEVPVVCSLEVADYRQLNDHFYVSAKDARYILAERGKGKTCWEDIKSGLESRAQEHIEELKLYFPCSH